MAKPRVLISTDIGGADPDDIQSMVHAFLYADKINLVGLVSTPTKHGGRAADIHKVIDAYAKDYSKLKTWSSDYPTPEYLRSITKQGGIPVAPAKGWSAPTEGSKAIVKAAHESDQPLWVLTWGATTDLAQALHDDPSIKSKIKVYSVGSWNTKQDPAARDYIYNSHKDLWWIEMNSTGRGMYVDDRGKENNAWKMGDARGHGALGEYFYAARPWGLKAGDTPSLLYLLDQAPDGDPTAASWGGAFVKTGHGPNHWTDNKNPALMNGGYHGAETVQKFQSAFYKDFALRLDRAKTAKPDSKPEPSEPAEPGTLKPVPTPPAGEKNEPVKAVDDLRKTGLDEKNWFASKLLLQNDKAPDGGLKIASIDSTSAKGGTITWDAVRGITVYRPKEGFQGEDRFNYTIIDADGSTDIGTVTFKVGSGGSKPAAPAPAPVPSAGDKGHAVTAVDDIQKIQAGKAHYVGARHLLSNDKAPDGGAHIVNVADYSAKGARVSYNDGVLIYRPKAGVSEDTVQYTVADANASTDLGVIHFDILLP